MAGEQRKAAGMRERSPGVWELIVEAGRDPVTGKRRQVSRLFRGNLRNAKKARAALSTEVGRGRHSGTRTTVDDLFYEWVRELERKGRSPNTVHNYEKVYHHDIEATLGKVPVAKVTTKMDAEFFLILGQIGFYDQFTVTMNHRLLSVHVGDVETFPDGDAS